MIGRSNNLPAAGVISTGALDSTHGNQISAIKDILGNSVSLM